MISQQDFTATIESLSNGQKLQFNLGEVLEDLFMVLKEKEKDVIIKRFGLDNSSKKTLEAIGQEYSITRERVRQIENVALNKLRRVLPNTNLSIINHVAKDILHTHGGILLEDHLVSKILNQLAKTEELDGYIIKLSLNIDNSFIKQHRSNEFHPFWYESNISME